MIDSWLDQFNDQVILKEIAAAELDCTRAQQAVDDLILVERLRQLLGGSSTDRAAQVFADRALHLADIAAKCKRTYHVIDTPAAGGSWNGDCIDDLSKPFTVFFTGLGMTNTYIITPSSTSGGSLVEIQHVEMSGITMDYQGKGSYTIIPTDEDPDGNVIGMEIDYKTFGTAKSCVEGKCFTNKMESGNGVQIPLRVQKEACP